MATAQRNQRGTPERSEGLVERTRGIAASGVEKARSASERHVSIAMPFRAVERTNAVAASVLSGGVAYRLFLWLLPFAMIVGGALGLGNAQSIEEAVSHGGLPAAMVAAFGQIATSADTNSWWLLLAGVPLLLWEGYAGSKGLQRIHSLIWEEPARRSKPLASSLLFSAGMCTFVAAASLAWWVRDTQQLVQLPLLALMAVPIGGLWLFISLRLPHGSQSWKMLLPAQSSSASEFRSRTASSSTCSRRSSTRPPRSTAHSASPPPCSSSSGSSAGSSSPHQSSTGRSPTRSATTNHLPSRGLRSESTTGHVLNLRLCVHSSSTAGTQSDAVQVPAATSRLVPGNVGGLLRRWVEPGLPRSVQVARRLWPLVRWQAPS